MIMTSCGIPKPPQENELMENVPAEFRSIIIGNPFDELNIYEYDMDVTSVTIEKRQTNEKADTVYCVVRFDNEYYQFTRHLKMCFNYYAQGGWILDNCSEYSPAEWKVVKCPLSADDVAYVCDYPQVELEKYTFDGENGTASFYFNVEDVRNNGAFSGTMAVDCQFDGEKWSYTKNSDAIEFIWDIIGTWSYSKVEKTSYDSTVNEITVTIRNFDQSSVSMDGTWYMNSYFSLFGRSKTTIPLDDAERVKVGMDRALVELWENPNYYGMHSYVRFYPDKVEAAYTSPSSQHFGPIELERVAELEQAEDDSNKVVDYKVDIPSGFEEQEVEGVTKAWYNMEDRSNVNVNITEKDSAFKKITAEALKDAMVQLFEESYSMTPTITDKYFTSEEVCGMPAYQYSYEIELNGVEMTQLVVCIDADKTYTVTYTDTTGSWMGEFETSAKNINLTFE